MVEVPSVEVEIVVSLSLADLVVMTPAEDAY